MTEEENKEENRYKKEIGTAFSLMPLYDK